MFRESFREMDRGKRRKEENLVWREHVLEGGIFELEGADLTFKVWNNMLQTRNSMNEDKIF